MKRTELLTEVQTMLGRVSGEETANQILSNMFPEPIKGYKKGKLLTIGELKLLPKNSIIHLWYKDDDNHLRNDDFVTFCGYDGSGELYTTCGFTIPIDNHNDDELIERFDNCGWEFTVREALLNST